ncbi:hypothetical protein GCM10025867_29120 [Frondihabitans sucicola]|uniref:Lipoprotein n=1 Tax=Frondihabitans sucicola TaxID=1268041 RepID=A0ABM8GQT8_9MICO|nr:hypothetical protein GCM10025867_29120 [Frondihabitans sucicola]
MVAAFVVGGALTGGLTAAAAAGSGDQSSVESLMATTARYDVEAMNHGRLLGEPRFETFQGTSDIRVSAAPPGANRLVVSFQCLDPATYAQRLDGAVVSTPVRCGTESNVTPSTKNPWTNIYQPAAGGTQTVTVEAPGDARYAVWVSWMKAAVLAEPSAQQAAETADGKVTFEEYTNAFNRLQACMAEAGFPEAVVPFADEHYGYTVPGDGATAFDTRCYPREFQDVDTLWQGEHPQK